MVGLLLNGRRLWQKGSVLSREVLGSELCVCCSFSAHQGMQHGDVQRSNIRARFVSPPEYEGPVIQNGGLVWAHNHQSRLTDTVPKVLIVNKTLGSCNSGQCIDKNTTDCFNRSHYGDFYCYPKPFNTITSKYSSNFMNFLPQSRRICLGTWSRKRRDTLWLGRRSFVSAGSLETMSNFGSGSRQHSASSTQASDVVEAETDASSSESDEDFDFRNFPALTSSFYQDYERPSEMEVKKRVPWQIRHKLFKTDNELTVESIPQPKGRAYDFGLGDISSKPPPLEAGARPQGGFDIDISLDECESAPLEMPLSSLASAQKPPNRKLPCDAPGRQLVRDQHIYSKR